MKAFIDANVFVSKWIADVILSLAETGSFEPFWSDKVLDEAAIAFVRLAGGGAEGAIRRYLGGARAAFPAALVSDWEPLESDAVLPDPDDRHVLAAARRAGADVIVTFNLKDFPSSILAPYGIAAVSPDVFLTRLADDSPEAVFHAVRSLVESKKRPPRTMREELDHLRRTGVPEFVSRMESMLR